MESVIKEFKAFAGNAPHIKTDTDSFVCVFKGCQDKPNPELSAPLCMEHAKKLTVQVMLLTSNTIRPITGKMNNRAIDRLAPKRERASKPGLVYFVQFGDRIKIGYTTNLDRRMEAVPNDKILALVAGSMADERKYHAKFDDIRITGEWFANDPRLTDFIKTLPKHELLAA